METAKNSLPGEPVDPAAIAAVAQAQQGERISSADEYLGRVVRGAWVNYCRAQGDTKPSHLTPWEKLSDRDKGAAIAIGRAVAREFLANGLAPAKV